MLEIDRTIIESPRSITLETPIWESGENTKSFTFVSLIPKSNALSILFSSLIIFFDRDEAIESIDSLSMIILSTWLKSSFIKAIDSESTSSSISIFSISDKDITCDVFSSVTFKICRVSSSSIMPLKSSTLRPFKASANSWGKTSASKYSRSPPLSLVITSSL